MNYIAIMIFKVFLTSVGIFTLPSDRMFDTLAQCEQYINSSDSRAEIVDTVKGLAQETGSKDIILSNMVCVSDKSDPI